MRIFLNVGIRFVGVVMLLGVVFVVQHFFTPEIPIKELFFIYWNIILKGVIIASLFIVFITGLYLVIEGEDAL